jgi:hypothetical protein
MECGCSARQMATLVFTGAFDTGEFAIFVQDRADKLNLTATLLDRAPDRMRVAVFGVPAMIDAFEMACSLGPLSCLVRDVVRAPA